MRAWLKVLHDRHPQVTCVPASHQSVSTLTAPTNQLTAQKAKLSPIHRNIGGREGRCCVLLGRPYSSWP
jgi:hypothetical protein